MRPRSDLRSLFGIEYPLVQAPMAGGITSAALVAGASRAGALGFAGAAYWTPEQISDFARDVRERTDRPFGINLFADGEAAEPDNPAPLLELLRPYHEQLGLPPPTAPALERIPFEEQLEAVLESGAAAFSFTFGIPAQSAIERARSRGLVVLGTATTVNEARLLEAAGVNAVVAQGSEAGGHRGTFAGPAERALIGTMALVPQVVDAVKVPVIAAGGIMDGRGIVAALCLGASGVQMGTAFLRCEEAGTWPAHRDALRGATDDATILTRAFTGRPARALRNTFAEELAGKPDAVLPYPWQNLATRPLRTAAAERGDERYLPLWAGQAARLSRALPVEDLVRELIAEASQVLASLR